MKMVKCDRCGTIDDGLIYSSITGYEPIYTGKIFVYTVDDPILRNVDLCRKCAAEFHELVSEFMPLEASDENKH